MLKVTRNPFENDSIVAMKQLLTTIRHHYQDDHSRPQIAKSPLDNLDSVLRSHVNEVRFLEGLIGSSRVQSKSRFDIYM